MQKVPLYAIGHSTRKAEDFLSLLKTYGIQYLADVRSRPYSKFNPQYSREALEVFLEANGITYVFMGDALGGRPEDPSCYDAEGRISYETVKSKAFFEQGIERLKTAWEKNIPLAVMCSEDNPCHCHRSRLIGSALQETGIDMVHIDEKGLLKTQDEVMRELQKKPKHPGLF